MRFDCGPMRFLARYWFIVVLVFVVAPAGMLAPDAGRALSSSSWALPLLVATTLGLSGFLLDAGQLSRQVGNLRAILLATFTTYALAPILAYGLALAWGPSLHGENSDGYYFLEAMMLSAAQASTLASALAFTLIARGDGALALILTVLSNTLTVFLTPLVLQLSIGARVSFAVWEMVARMALIVLLPVVVGQLARRLFWQRLEPVAPALRLLPQWIMLCFVYTGVSTASTQLAEKTLLVLQFVGASATLHAALILWCWLSSSWLGLSPAARTAVVFSGTQKTLPNGIYLWKAFFPQNPYGAMGLVLYHLFQLLAAPFLLPWLTVPADDAGDEPPR